MVINHITIWFIIVTVIDDDFWWWWWLVIVGALEHDFYDFPFSWECHHPNWRTPSFFRGVGQQPTRLRIIWRSTFPRAIGIPSQLFTIAGESIFQFFSMVKSYEKLRCSFLLGFAHRQHTSGAVFVWPANGKDFKPNRGQFREHMRRWFLMIKRWIQPLNICVIKTTCRMHSGTACICWPWHM
jgi:hypothetical protein